MKKILLVTLLSVCMLGLAQPNVFADAITINNVLYDGGKPYTGLIDSPTYPDPVNTRAVSFDLITNIGGLQGFCVEGHQTFNIPPSAPYTTSAVDTPNEYKAAFIAQTYFAGGFNYLDTLDLDNVEAAAQYAIWQLLQPTSSFGASWTTLAAAMRSQADTAVAGGFTGANWFILTNADQQDFIAKIPEPSTLLLIGLGLVGLAGLSRRRFKG
jgi:hypothetical protein